MTLASLEGPRDRQFADLTNVQRQLTLSRIMTPRAEFICCTSEETTQAVMARVPTIYDAVPVVEGNDPDNVLAPVIGLLFRDRVPFQNSAALVRNTMDTTALDNAHPLESNLVVYIHGMTGSPIEFVDGPEGIVGLVTPYDLERLPVRTALFAMIIDVEQAMGELINARLPDPSIWEKYISSGLRGELSRGLRRATQNDSVGQAILSVDFKVKLDLLQHCFERTAQVVWVTNEKDEIRELRNLVAHGAPFPNVKALPGQVRNLIRLRALIRGRIKEAVGG